MTDTSTTDSSSAPPTAPSPPSPSPADIFREIKLAAVTAELLKPVAAATEDLISADPAKQKARDAIHSAYAKAAGTTASPGRLRLDYLGAEDKFRIVADDMEPRLDAWIARWLAPTGALHSLIKQRMKAAGLAEERAGPLEGARDKAAARTRKWAAKFADWSAPDKRIEIPPVAEMTTLNNSINNKTDLDYSIYRFWFDIAPKLLGAAETEPAGLAGLGKIRTALKTDFPALAEALEPGGARLDGPVYLLDPGALGAKREAIRKAWEAAAKAQIDPEIKYRAEPDDTASVVKRREQLDKQYDEAVRGTMPPAAKP
jgi:hypothetical protein